MSPDETGFYYLQSRYYDPENCRFINADSYASTGSGFLGYNMFAYCNNTPVNGWDPCGTCYHSSDPMINCHMCIGRPLGEGSTYVDGSLKYATQDEAAFVAGVGTRLRTNIDNNEYACGIYCDQNGNYSIGTYFKGKHDSVSVDPIEKEDTRNKNLTLVAIVHSHPYCNGHVPNEFSTRDQLGRALGDLFIAYSMFKPIYLAAPNGSLQVLMPYRNRKDNLAYKIKVVCRGLPKDKTKENCG